MATRFNTGDKVFAKVRGYPPWPAAVQEIDASTSLETKYKVSFYGTSETATCKEEDLFLYTEFKAKYGKPLKYKGFTEALIQIEKSLGQNNPVFPAPTTPVSTRQGKAKGTTKATRQRKETPASCESNEKKPNREVMDEPSLKRTEKLAHDSDSTIDESDSEPTRYRKSQIDVSELSVKVEIMEISRSGRTIKPIETKAPAEGGEGANYIDNNKLGSPDYPKVLYTIAPNGTAYALDLNYDRPQTFENEKARLQWDTAAITAAVLNARSLRDQAETGYFAPTIDGKHIVQLTNEDTLRVKAVMDDAKQEKQRQEESKTESIRFMSTEMKLVEIDVTIKASLTLTKGDVDVVLDKLSILDKTNIVPLMLKKHPDIVATVRMLRRYAGLPEKWGYTGKTLADFQTKAEQIRKMADHMFNKFKALFGVPECSQFWTYFQRQVQEFKNLTKEMTKSELDMLQVDPCLK